MAMNIRKPGGAGAAVEAPATDGVVERDLSLTADLSFEEGRALESSKGGERRGRRSAYRRFLHNPSAVFGAVIVGMVVIAAIFAPLLAPHAPNTPNYSVRLRPPAWGKGGSWSYPLGTDDFGRDILSRLIYGARTAVTIGLAATVLTTVAGVTLGLVAGTRGGWLDTLISRVADVQLSFPYILLGIAVIAIYGPSTFLVIVVLAFSGWVPFTRIVRSEVQGLKHSEFINAAVSSGARRTRIMVRHFLPNVMPAILVLATFAVAGNILGESTLSFLGLGVPPPTATWGGMLADGREYIYSNWWLITWPGLALMIAVLGVNQLGDGLRDYLDPHLRGRV
jgi:ABC-type dipeptide/oligopeptide/nickel transport system permease subunit